MLFYYENRNVTDIRVNARTTIIYTLNNSMYITSKDFHLSLQTVEEFRRSAGYLDLVQDRGVWPGLISDIYKVAENEKSQICSGHLSGNNSDYYYYLFKLRLRNIFRIE